MTTYERDRGWLVQTGSQEARLTETRGQRDPSPSLMPRSLVNTFQKPLGQVRTVRTSQDLEMQLWQITFLQPSLKEKSYLLADLWESQAQETRKQEAEAPWGDNTPLGLCPDHRDEIHRTRLGNISKPGPRSPPSHQLGSPGKPHRPPKTRFPEPAVPRFSLHWAAQPDPRSRARQTHSLTGTWITHLQPPELSKIPRCYTSPVWSYSRPSNPIQGLRGRGDLPMGARAELQNHALSTWDPRNPTASGPAGLPTG